MAQNLKLGFEVLYDFLGDLDALHAPEVVLGEHVGPQNYGDGDSERGS